MCLLGLLNHGLTKQNTIMRNSIPPAERLIATLTFLATGSSYERLKFQTGIAAQTLGYIIPETCKVMVNTLMNEYMKVSIKQIKIYMYFIILKIQVNL